MLKNEYRTKQGIEKFREEFDYSKSFEGEFTLNYFKFVSEGKGKLENGKVINITYFEMEYC